MESCLEASPILLGSALQVALLREVNKGGEVVLRGIFGERAVGLISGRIEGNEGCVEGRSGREGGEESVDRGSRLRTRRDVGCRCVCRGASQPKTSHCDRQACLVPGVVREWTSKDVGEHDVGPCRTLRRLEEIGLEGMYAGNK